jgi:hypothetical protein
VVAAPIAVQALATGGPAEQIARALVDRLAAPGLQVAFVFADHRLDPHVLARTLRALGAPVVGCTTTGTLGPGCVPTDEPSAVALGLYGEGVRVGVGIAPELSKAALARSSEAVHHAAVALGTTTEALDPGRHVAITLVDGCCDCEEAFCIGSAASAPKIRFIGGAASTDVDLVAPRREDRRTYVWANGEVLSDAGVVVVLDSEQPFHAVTSSHLVATQLRPVV